MLRRHGHSVLKWLLLISSVLFVYSLGQEFRTQIYLKGFADAIVPASVLPEQKVESILAWMRHPPVSLILDKRDTSSLDPREPLDTLNNSKFLEVCGTAVNGFINLARAVGLRARPLILVGWDYGATHVVVEVRLGDRWIVVDPAFRRIMRDASGRMLTKGDLRDPRLLAQATVGLKNFLPIYSYERTTLVHLEVIPYLGSYLRKGLNNFYPEWGDRVGAVSWLFGRRSSIRLFASSLLFCLSAVAFLVFSHTSNSSNSERTMVLTSRIPDQRRGWTIAGDSAE
jgi:hypothetical protein